MNPYNYKKVFRYLPGFLKFVFGNFPVAYASVVVTVAGIAMEYAALSIMIPLSGTGRSAGASSAGVMEFWRDFIAVAGLPEEPRTWLWLFLLFLAIRIAVAFVQVMLNTHVAKQIFARLSTSAFSRVVSDVPMSEIYKRSVGHYVALAGDESVRVGLLFFYLAQAAAALIAAVIGLAVLYVFSAQAFEFTMYFLLACAVVLGLLMRRVFDLSAEALSLSKEAHTTFLESLNGLRSIRSMAGERYVQDRYLRQIRRYAKVLFQQDAFNQSTRTMPGLILLLAALVALFPGVDLLGDVSVVYFFIVTTLLIRVLSFLGTAVSSAVNVVVNIRAVFELDDIIGKNDIPKHAQGLEQVGKVRNVRFSGLDCGYSPDHLILRGLNAEVRAGRSYAVVGKSGSGKSTLSDVLLGLLAPVAGELQIGDMPYGRIDLTSMRRRVVLVEQQTRIFSGTIRENISFGLAASDQAIQAAADAAGLGEFIRELPGGMQTQLEYQGANLSGGQRQRIGLARAIVREPDMLILDEATSALDAQTRDTVLSNLRTLFHDKILLFITHDKHVIDAADEVWLLEKGRLMTRTKAEPV